MSDPLMGPQFPLFFSYFDAAGPLFRYFGVWLDRTPWWSSDRDVPQEGKPSEFSLSKAPQIPGAAAREAAGGEGRGLKEAADGALRVVRSQFERPPQVPPFLEPQM